MSRTALARWTFGLTAAFVLAGIIIQVGVTANADDAYFEDMTQRIFNIFCYFTVQSNIIVGVTCAMLAVNPDRRSTVFRVFRLAGLIDIAITGVVYHIALADLQELTGDALVADQLLHSVVPVATVLGWLAFGPRGAVSWPIIGWATLIPIGWTIFVLIRGPIVDFYPYPFIDVRIHGYAVVFRNMALVAAVFLLFAALVRWLDRVLTDRGLSLSTA